MILGVSGALTAADVGVSILLASLAAFLAGRSLLRRKPPFRLRRLSVTIILVLIWLIVFSACFALNYWTR